MYCDVKRLKNQQYQSMNSLVKCLKQFLFFFSCSAKQTDGRTDRQKIKWNDRVALLLTKNIQLST